ncbi:unnamed protein product [Pylaiella littoralis]
MATSGTLQLRRTAVGAAVQRFAPKLLARCSNPRRGVASCLLRSTAGRGESSGAHGTPTSAPPRAARKLLPRASCRQLSSSPPRQGQLTGVEPREPAEESDERSKNGAATVSNNELNEKWGWTTSDPLYWPYKIMGVFSTKNTNALSSARMLQTCLNNAECTEWYSEGKISNEFLPKLLWLSTNVWLMSRRLLKEGERGKKVQEFLFDELWRETKRQMRSIEVSEMMLKKYLSEAQQHTFLTLVQYDHAYTLESREERMHILTSALWRGVFMSDESIKEPHVRVLAEYIDSELDDIYAVDASEFFAVCIELAPPPAAGFKAAAGSKKLLKGGGASRLSAKEKGAARGVRGTADDVLAAAEGGGLVEKVQHGDYGGGDGKNGRWRACLAESGKVYYWHTLTREVTWTRPADSEAYVASVMPKTEQTPATAVAT